MADTVPFKSYFGVELAHLLADRLGAAHPPFPAQSFVERVGAEVEPLELKARVALIAQELRRALPPAYLDALAILLRILGPENDSEFGIFDKGYFLYPVAHFVEVYGHDDPAHVEASIHALYEITKRFTAEYGVRPYLIKYPDQTLAHLARWAHDPNVHVRRWVSEGTRPRLPWAGRLTQFIRDPDPVLRLLEPLRDDPSLYVRKSVANNLNDIAKDHPERVLATLERWLEHGSEGTRWVASRALRTLVKQGHPAALALLGTQADADGLTVADFAVAPAAVRVGGAVTLTCALHNGGDEEQAVIIDYVVHLVKANGGTSPKVFKGSKRTLAAGETAALTKTLPLRQVTTRTYYPGRHVVEVQVNGRRLAQASFDLLTNL